MFVYLRILEVIFGIFGVEYIDDNIGICVLVRVISMFIRCIGYIGEFCKYGFFLLYVCFLS